MAEDKILMHGLIFHGHHGFIPAEQELGQKFEVDVELVVDLSPAAVSDDLRKTVDYAQVYREIQQIVEGKRYKLLETVAEEIAQSLLGRFPVRQALVRVKKPHVPIRGPVDYMGVEIVRKRE